LVKRDKRRQWNLSFIGVESNRLNNRRENHILDKCIVAELDSELHRRISRDEGALRVAQARETCATKGHVERLVKCDFWVVYQLTVVVERLLKIRTLLLRQVHYMFLVCLVNFDPGRKNVFLIFCLDLMSNLTAVDPQLLCFSLKLAKVDIVILREIWSLL
jgi:hypothetical protein